MDRGDAYKLLADRLEELRREGYQRLVTRVSLEPVRDTTWFQDEAVEIEIEVSWADRKRQKLCVRASALGSNTWRFDRLDESIIIGPDKAAGR